jgi:hypothetical protein
MHCEEVFWECRRAVPAEAKGLTEDLTGPRAMEDSENELGRVEEEDGDVAAWHGM